MNSEQQFVRKLEKRADRIDSLFLKNTPVNYAGELQLAK